MYQRTDAPGAGLMRRLYREFEQFYSAERCRWAPTNPRRVFNLAFEVVYPKFSNRVTEEEFAGVVYTTLGFPGSKPPGMFEMFDPAMYRGNRPFDDHFVNWFKARLEWRVRDLLRTRSGRRGKRERPHDHAQLDRALERRWRPRNIPEQQLVDALPEALDRLPTPELTVVRMTYWGRYSLREVAVELGLDRGTVRRRHDAALARLRAFYGVPEKSAA